MEYAIDLETFDFDIKRFQRRLFNYGFRWVDSGRDVKSEFGNMWRYIMIDTIKKTIYYDDIIYSTTIIIKVKQFLKDIGQYV